MQKFLFLVIVMLGCSLSFSKSNKSICKELDAMVLSSSSNSEINKGDFKFQNKEKVKWYGLMCTTVGSTGAIYVLGNSGNWSGGKTSIACASALCLVSGLTITIKY